MQRVLARTLTSQGTLFGLRHVEELTDSASQSPNWVYGPDTWTEGSGSVTPNRGA